MLHTIDPKLHGPLGEPMAKAIETCVHCGFCLPTCPTYEISGQEMDTPRGRIVLMKEILEGQLELTDATTYLDRCLGCLACETACPSGVAYRELIGPFQAQVENRRQRPLAQRLRRWLIANTVPYPSRLRLAAHTRKLGKWLQPWVPTFLQPMLRLLPQQLPAQTSWPERVPAVGRRRARVALLIGCVQQTLAPDINTDCIEVLTRNGVEVIVPSAQRCCGALAWHGGNLPDARRFAMQNLSAFPTDVDAVLTNAAGCGSALQEYHLILQGTPQAEQADRFRRRVCDISSFLEQLDDLQPVPELIHPLTIAYHDACHLAHAQNVRQQPRALLQRIPGVQLIEVPGMQSCCGSAGTYNIDQPHIAALLGADLAGNLIATEADRIATGNIGCLMQIRMHLAEQGSTIPVHHTISLLAQAYRQQLHN